VQREPDRLSGREITVDDIRSLAGPATPLVDALPNPTYVELARTDHAKTPKSFEFIDASLDFLRDLPPMDPAAA
jgi:hypothetical protein